MGHMGLDRIDRDIEVICEFGIGHSTGRYDRILSFARRQGFDKLAPKGRRGERLRSPEDLPSKVRM